MKVACPTECPHLAAHEAFQRTRQKERYREVWVQVNRDLRERKERLELLLELRGNVEVDGAEVCSAGVGPHPLDGNWGVVDPWVGLGFGLERLIMAREGYPNIERVGRSLAYVDGVRHNV